MTVVLPDSSTLWAGQRDGLCSDAIISSNTAFFDCFMKNTYSHVSI